MIVTVAAWHEALLKCGDYLYLTDHDHRRDNLKNQADRRPSAPPQLSGYALKLRRIETVSSCLSLVSHLVCRATHI